MEKIIVNYTLTMASPSLVIYDDIDYLAIFGNLMTSPVFGAYPESASKVMCVSGLEVFNFASSHFHYEKGPCVIMCHGRRMNYNERTKCAAMVETGNLIMYIQ